jgi:hypothetical protein
MYSKVFNRHSVLKVLVANSVPSFGTRKKDFLSQVTIYWHMFQKMIIYWSYLYIFLSSVNNENGDWIKDGGDKFFGKQAKRTESQELFSYA